MVYLVDTGNKFFPFTARIVKNSADEECSDATIQYTMNDEPGFVSIDSMTRTLTINTNNLGDIDSHSFILVATLTPATTPATTAQFSISLEVAHQCKFAELTPVSSMDDIEYTVYSPSLTLPFPLF